ncbi:type II CAAX prenyl endopeptidase Rce1 family protein [Pimelobacter simplex]|nr:CPBP family glutamic-type intramembrane protease [Pimelobacter simplex]
MPSADGAPRLRYDELHRLGPAGAWRPFAGIPALVVLFFMGQVVLSVVVTTILVAGGDTSKEAVDHLSGDPTTPAFLALVNLGWAVAIPMVWLVARALHEQRPGWVASVVGAFRWRWFAACLGIAVVALALTLLVSTVLPDQGAGSVDVGDRLNPWTSTVRDFLLVIVLLTPLQAAGEEFVFRGYLAQAFGGLAAGFGARTGAAVAVVVPAVLFALAHGLGQDVPIFFDRLAFGLVAGLLVLLTGGLEAGIAMHVLNNFFAFGLALAFGDMTSALNPTGGTWWAIPVTLTQSLSYLLLAVLAARRLGIADRTDPATSGAILEARRGRV